MGPTGLAELGYELGCLLAAAARILNYRARSKARDQDLPVVPPDTREISGTASLACSTCPR